MIEENQKRENYIEKGAAEPHFMPAIMGWISMERQKKRARELIYLSEKISSKADE